MSLRPALEAIAGRPLSVDDLVQDAAYFASLYLVEPREEESLRYDRMTFAISFSCFGSLVAIHNEGVFSDSTVERMIATLESHGFVHVPDDVLREPYTGPNEGFAGLTWMHRYFDYT